MPADPAQTPCGTPSGTPPTEARSLAGVTVPGWTIEYVGEAGSTNAVAAERVRAGAPDRLGVVTDHQTAGRGRLDRTWETPAGVALTVSLVLDPAQPDERWPWLPLLVGLAVLDAVHETTPVVARLKWPNDVLVGERKLAGILLERVVGPSGPLAVAGTGINVHQQHLPVGTATSLALEGAAVERAPLLEALLGAIDVRLAEWGTPDGPARLRTAYRAECATIGRDVVAHLPGGEVREGRAVDVDEQGRIVLELGAGTFAVGAGDVVHLRATQV